MYQASGSFKCMWKNISFEKLVILGKYKKFLGLARQPVVSNWREKFFRLRNSFFGRGGWAFFGG